MLELNVTAAAPAVLPGKEQQAAGVGILLQISMLVLSFVLGHVLRRHKFYYLPEASASLLIGPRDLSSRMIKRAVYELSYPGPAAIFSGPVRKWKKKWVTLAAPAAASAAAAPHLVLYKWTQADNGAADKDAADPAKPEPPPHRKFRYVPASEKKQAPAEEVNDGNIDLNLGLKGRDVDAGNDPKSSDETESVVPDEDLEATIATDSEAENERKRKDMAPDLEMRV